MLKCLKRDNMNILITSVGRRVKIIEYFKYALRKQNGKVIAVDCDVNAPALYFADKYEIAPRIDDSNYIDFILDICKRYNIKGIVSLIDPELSLLAKHEKIFKRNNIKLVLSPIELIDISYDKHKTYKYLSKRGIPTVPTYNQLDEVLELINNDKLKFPLIVKPSKGSASIGLYQVKNKKELIDVFSKKNNQIIQPYYKEKEYGIDIYIDLITGELIDMFIKEKINMRAGETDKSQSIHNKEIENLIKNFVNKSSFKGPIDIDCFEYKGKYYISEINPRFGGGYPHAYEMGCDFMRYIINNLNNIKNKPFERLNYQSGIKMLKYDSIKIIS